MANVAFFMIMLNVVMFDFHYAECRYVEFRYADCHYAECRVFS